MTDYKYLQSTNDQDSGDGVMNIRIIVLVHGLITSAYKRLCNFASSKHGVQSLLCYPTRERDVISLVDAEGIGSQATFATSDGLHAPSS